MEILLFGGGQEIAAGLRDLFKQGNLNKNDKAIVEFILRDITNALK